MSFTYVYIIHNAMFPVNTYKLELNQQNEAHIIRNHRKYYPDEIKIINKYLVNYDEKLESLQKYKIADYFYHIELELLKQILTIIQESICIDTVLVDVITSFIKKTCVKSDQKTKIITIYNLYGNSISYFDFKIYLEKSKAFDIETDAICNLSVITTNPYEKFFQSTDIDKTVDIKRLCIMFRQWFVRTYPQTTLPHKIARRKNLKYYLDGI